MCKGKLQRNKLGEKKAKQGSSVCGITQAELKQLLSHVS